MPDGRLRVKYRSCMVEHLCKVRIDCVTFPYLLHSDSIRMQIKIVTNLLGHAKNENVWFN